MTTVAKTPAEIEAEVLGRYRELTGKTLLAADPRRLLLQSIVGYLSQLRTLIELADRRNLPFDADGASLLALGIFVGVQPLPGQGSVVTVRYSRGTTLVELVIPAGHRVTTPDGTFLWATTAELRLPIGTATGDVTARCTVLGPDSNDLPPGAISILVDPIAGVSVTNTTTTDGGANAQTDDEFRPVVIAAPDGFTIAGPRSAYEWLAKQASPLVIGAVALGPDDVDDAAPAAGGVAVLLLIGRWSTDAVPVLELETDPDVIADVIALVEAALTADEVRPIGDLVTVTEAAAVSYDVAVEYWIPQDQGANVAAIQSSVAAAQAAYLDWQDSALGRDVDPSELQARLFAAGARRIVIASPVYAAVQRSEVARRGTVAEPAYRGLFR